MNLKLLLGYAAPYRVSLALAGTLMLAESAAALGVPWFAGLLCCEHFDDEFTVIDPLFAGSR